MTTATNIRVNTWSNIGTEVNATTVEEVLNQANLNYEVAAQSIFTTIGDKNIEIPKRKAIVRDDGHIYNVLSDSYTIIQNKDAFDFIKKFCLIILLYYAVIVNKRGVKTL